MSSQSAHPCLYVHVPFCGGKCAYCDFFSVPDLSLAPQWLDAISLETRHYQEQFPPFATLYLGGGTPSILSLGDFARLMELLRQAFAFSPDAEVTLEANPEDVSPEKLALWQGFGVNRLSLGVQSLDDAELTFLGRRHNARRAREALAACRHAGFANLGVDLIYALPGQTMDCWERTLAQVLEYAPEHLSCYQLTIETGTPLAGRLAQGQFPPAGEDAQAEFFLFTSRFLTAKGYFHYEISNFARSEDLVSRHNCSYWDHTPYVGLGPGAHSFDGRRRWWNHRSLGDYCRAASEGAPPVAGEEILTPEQLRLEMLMLGLRTRRGIPLGLINSAEGEDQLQRLVDEGLLILDGDKAVPTPLGWLVADRLPWWL
jgi:oxygen-independent coproporphyrinogen-3 oxidase